MTKLNASDRNKLTSGQFGLPNERKYPIEDRSHAGKAKGRASEMRRKGRISAAQEHQIDARANKVLGYGR